MFDCFTIFETNVKFQIATNYASSTHACPTCTQHFSEEVIVSFVGFIDTVYSHVRMSK